MRVISWEVQDPLASQEEFYSMELAQAVGWILFGKKPFSLLVETLHICCYSSSLQVNTETGHDHFHCAKQIQLRRHKKTSTVGHEPFRYIECEVLISHSTINIAVVRSGTCRR